jgi:hypothetical protein
MANANAFSEQSGLGGIDSSVANANAQSVNVDTPLGDFGASSANSFSEGFQAGQGGLSVSFL